MRWRRLGVPLCAAVVLFAQDTRYGIGRPASESELAAWDIAIGPEGKELPIGRGTAAEGAPIYAQKCASCHGARGVGGPFDVLAGGRGTLSTAQPLKTIGSFWPYATTVWDYVNRATPQGAIGTLDRNEVYALTAYLLNINGIIRDDEVMNAKTLPSVRMPNRTGFVPDVRPDWTDRASRKKTR